MVVQSPPQSASTADGVRIAVIVDPSLPPGLVANTVATLSIGLGAALPVLGDTPLRDSAGRLFRCSANRPVPVLQASGNVIRELMLRALPAPEAAMVVPFPRFARSIQSFEDYLDRFPSADLAEETIEGLGLAGPGKWIRSLTGSLKLFSGGS